MTEEPKDYLCSGCGSPFSKCGPPLWATQRKCCPDCEHTPEGQDEYRRFYEFVVACETIARWLGHDFKNINCRPPHFPTDEATVYAVIGTLQGCGVDTNKIKGELHRSPK